MAYEYLQNVRYVAHVHFLVYGGEQLPVEIGISNVLSKDECRRSLFLTIERTEKMTERDRRINRVVTAKSSTLPLDGDGEYTQVEAEELALRFVGKELVAVKGHDAEAFFRSIGMPRVVDIGADCPKYWHWQRPQDHLNSRMSAILLAKFLEEKRGDWRFLPSTKEQQRQEMQDELMPPLKQRQQTDDPTEHVIQSQPFEAFMERFKRGFKNNDREAFEIPKLLRDICTVHCVHNEKKTVIYDKLPENTFFVDDVDKFLKEFNPIVKRETRGYFQELDETTVNNMKNVNFRSAAIAFFYLEGTWQAVKFGPRSFHNLDGSMKTVEFIGFYGVRVIVANGKLTARVLYYVNHNKSERDRVCFTMPVDSSYPDGVYEDSLLLVPEVNLQYRREDQGDAYDTTVINFKYMHNESGFRAIGMYAGVSSDGGPRIKQKFILDKPFKVTIFNKNEKATAFGLQLISRLYPHLRTHMAIHYDSHGLNYSYFETHDDVFDTLEREIEYLPRESTTIRIFGKERPMPRRMAAYGDPGTKYKFSGRTFVARPWTKALRRLKKVAESHLPPGCRFNFAVVNRYDDGLDSIGPHKDDEVDLDPNFPIVSFSFGSERTFVFKRAGYEKHALKLKSGSVLVMKPPTNQFWTHEIPKQKRVKTARINVTFRKIVDRKNGYF
ncbi:unnamed protein product [Larinioides sclopetarius]|uniref:DNA oxidative demethylase ALKBH2 n=2 Tax=Larinioides sclopetarius TaxID=280406 RepID=A0AAV2BZU9_9ARAC